MERKIILKLFLQKYNMAKTRKLCLGVANIAFIKNGEFNLSPYHFIVNITFGLKTLLCYYT